MFGRFEIQSTVDATPSSGSRGGARGAETASNPWKSGFEDGGRLNSPRARTFADLFTAIRKMIDLPEDHSLHLDVKAGRRAEEILALLRNNLEVDAPKLFPHEGDCLVFTWDSSRVKRMMAIEEDDIEITDLLKKDFSRHHWDGPEDNDEDMWKWVLRMSGNPASYTGDKGGNVSR